MASQQPPLSKVVADDSRRFTMETPRIVTVGGRRLKAYPFYMSKDEMRPRKATPFKRAAPVVKRRWRRDRGEVEDIIFKLYERQPNWSLYRLEKETDQPVQYLKEILSDLCVFNGRGPNQGTYELKPEHKAQ